MPAPVPVPAPAVQAAIAPAAQPAPIPQFAGAIAAEPAPIPQFAGAIAAEPAPIPQFAGAIAAASNPNLSTAGGIPQFASVVEPAWPGTPAATDNAFGGTSGFSFGDSFGSTPTSGFDPYGATPTAAAAAAPAWYGQSAQPSYLAAPTNGPAIAGLVLSLVGLGLPGLIASIVGLRRARSFEAEGLLPVGRLPARWGLGLSIASMTIGLGSLIIWGVTIAIFGAALTTVPDSFGDDTSIVVDDGVTDDGILPDDTGVTDGGTGDGTVTQAQLEQLATQQVIDSFEETPASVSCPSLTPNEDGMYNCTATMADGSEIQVGVNIF
jgi:hypothetical protein